MNINVVEHIHIIILKRIVLRYTKYIYLCISNNILIFLCENAYIKMNVVTRKYVLKIFLENLGHSENFRGEVSFPSDYSP